MEIKCYAYLYGIFLCAIKTQERNKNLLDLLRFLSMTKISMSVTSDGDSWDSWQRKSVLLRNVYRNVKTNNQQKQLNSWQEETMDQYGMLNNSMYSHYYYSDKTKQNKNQSAFKIQGTSFTTTLSHWHHKGDFWRLKHKDWTNFNQPYYILFNSSCRNRLW